MIHPNEAASHSNFTLWHTHHPILSSGNLLQCLYSVSSAYLCFVFKFICPRSYSPRRNVNSTRAGTLLCVFLISPLLAILEVSQNICRIAVFTPMAPGGPGYALLGAPPMKYRESWDQRQPDFLTAAGCVASSPGLCPGKSFLPAEPPALTPMVDNRQNPGGAGNNHQSCHHSDSCILLSKKWCHLVGPLLAAHLQVPAQVAAVRWPRLPHFASPEPHQCLLYQQASLLIFESEILAYHTCNNRFILNIWIQFCLCSGKDWMQGHTAGRVLPVLSPNWFLGSSGLALGQNDSLKFLPTASRFYLLRRALV